MDLWQGVSSWFVLGKAETGGHSWGRGQSARCACFALVAPPHPAPLNHPLPPWGPPLIHPNLLPCFLAPPLPAFQHTPSTLNQWHPLAAWGPFSNLSVTTTPWSFGSQSLGGSVVKNPPANAGDTRDRDSIPGSGKIPWRRKWQPNPVFVPGKSHRQRSLEGYSPCGCKESDTTEHTHKLKPYFTCSSPKHPLFSSKLERIIFSSPRLRRTIYL